MFPANASTSAQSGNRKAILTAFAVEEAASANVAGAISITFMVVIAACVFLLDILSIFMTSGAAAAAAAAAGGAGGGGAAAAAAAAPPI